MQYFKHPNIARYLYDRHLAAYGRLPWNDEVPVYFAQMFYAEFFLGMKPNYNDLPSEFLGSRKGRLYDRKGAKRDVELPRPEPPLVSRNFAIRDGCDFSDKSRSQGCYDRECS